MARANVCLESNPAVQMYLSSCPVHLWLENVAGKMRWLKFAAYHFFLLCALFRDPLHYFRPYSTRIRF